MKRVSLIAISALVFGACSTPKYAYYFDRYDYNSGKKITEIAVATAAAEESPLIIIDENTTASASVDPVPVQTPVATPAPEQLAKKIASLSREEKLELKNELKAELRKIRKAKRSDGVESITGAKAMDHDLKMAAIFGAVGLVLSLFWPLSWVFGVLGVIALVIGVVFLIKWLARQ